ncbi:cytosolic phospholipase A2 beta-like [Protobothrops mucrosquamatus]|uniref:cytosolic phospholipase A2 beta-like n=1 Tax=Protobothrops mucrosquamatus TaxID=103944 RepID=UPI0010FB2806|nr:cytosolic phospholipase A2 beta-like [Protobothrops mucrosquamatus]
METTEEKNIIQLNVCDADPVTNDDIEFIVLFDLSKVQPGNPVFEKFSLKPKKQEQSYHYEFLEVEFKLSDVPGPSEQLISNGVLVARELSILDVKVNKEDNEKVLKANKNVVFSVQQSYEGTQKTSTNLDSFRFHCIKSFGPVLKVKTQNILANEDSDSDYSLILPLKLLPVGYQVKVELPMGKGSTFDLYLQVMDWSQNLDVRLGYELCPDEQDYLRERKKVVADALYKLFNLGEELQEDEVPVIALVATGGGIRAMTSLYAHLSAFQKLNLLDCITYITSASGSTWTLTNLYRHIDWSHQSFNDHIRNLKRQLIKNKKNTISSERLKQYHKELTERIKAGHLSSFTALWALIQEAFFHKGANPGKLSEQQQALTQGQNPFPIYTAINVKHDHVSTFDFREWLEFNPYEVSFLKYGAQIRSEDFDSEFFMGRVVKEIPESRICYLEGIWTNIFSPNLLDCLYWTATPDEFWERWVKDMEIKHENYSSIDYPATVYKPPSYPDGKLCEIFNDILTNRPLSGENHNFLQSFAFDKDYLHQKEFMQWSDTIFDTSSNKLTPNTSTLCLIDIGYFMNDSGISLLKPERNLDIIIFLDYEMSGILRLNIFARYEANEPDRVTPAGRPSDSQPLTLYEHQVRAVLKAVNPSKAAGPDGVLGTVQIKVTAEYCEIQGIPFPKIHLSEKERKDLKECYIFSDEDNPNAPIVLCFPLVCCTFKEYSAPGVKRTPSEMKEGKVNLEKGTSPYQTLEITYTEELLDKLINLCSYNVLNSKDFIFQAIQNAIQKKRHSGPRNAKQ